MKVSFKQKKKKNSYGWMTWIWLRQCWFPIEWPWMLLKSAQTSHNFCQYSFTNILEVTSANHFFSRHWLHTFYFFSIFFLFLTLSFSFHSYIFCFVPIGTDGISRTGMRTDTSQPPIPPRVKFRSVSACFARFDLFRPVSVDICNPVGIFFGFLYIFFGPW